MVREKFCINFEVNKEGNLFTAENNNVTVMNCSVIDGMLDFWMLFDFAEDKPLHLKDCVNKRDKISINIFPHRIELYTNGFLADEEWPYGNHFISDATMIEGECHLSVSEPKIVENFESDVIGSFQNAEGWKPEENVYVGDCMPYVYNERYHVLYLKDRHHHGSKWGCGAHQWNHISTDDFLNWNIHPMAVGIDNPNEGSICTGSWIYDGFTHYLFYTVRTCDGSPARICRSISEDGYHYKKDQDFSFTLSDKYTAVSARDPKIVKDADGIYHMILTTSIEETHIGCLAHLVSEDLNKWQECEQPIYVAPEGLGEPECPDYFYKDGYYYLVYSLKGKGYYQYSENPFSDWKMPENPIIPCKNVPKAGIWKNRLIFTGFAGDGGYAGTMTFLEAIVNKNGELTYKSLD